MCEKCEALMKNPEVMLHVENHNAIWQNALALKLVIHNTWLEMQDHDCNEYYGDLEEVFADFLKKINIVEQRSYELAKAAAMRL